MAYSSLNPQNREIRLVTLEPGEVSADIKCSLSIVSLLQNPTYEALSYTWGDTSQQARIYLADSPHSVTKNLATALRFLRWTDTPRKLWIDALSINQTDVDEKNSQIPQMGSIYSRASEVVAWLGEPEDADHFAIDAFLVLAEETMDGKHWGPPSRPATSSHNLTPDELRAISDLIAKPWWQRIWTAQELVLAKTLVFCCGTRQLRFETMYKMCESYFAHIQSCCEEYFSSSFDLSLLTKFNESLSVIDKLWVLRDPPKHISFGEAIEFFRNRESTDPRDMIYGLLGMVTNLPEGAIVPDYRASVSRVYEDATVALIKSARSLEVFSYVFRRLHSKQEGEVCLPSWVPDWSFHLESLYITQILIRQGFQMFFNADRGIPFNFERMSPGKAFVMGVIIGEIKSLSEPGPHGTENFSLEKYNSWKRAAGVDKDPDSLYPCWWSPGFPIQHPHAVYGYPSRLDAFFHTLCSAVIPKHAKSAVYGAAYERRRAAYNDRLLFNAWLDFLKRHGSSEEVQGFGGWFSAQNTASDYPEILLRTLWTNITATTVARRVFRMGDRKSNRDWIGIGPEDAEIGDCVAVLHGGKVPYVLRRGRDVENSGEVWRLVGDAYVQGVMDGEAMPFDERMHFNLI